MQDASFLHYSVSDCLMRLVQSTPAADTFFFKHTRTVDEAGKRTISSPHTADAWLRAEKDCIRRHSVLARVAGIILYADETMVNTLRGRAYYPIVMCIANHSLEYRCTKAGKIVIGYLPVLPCPRSVTRGKKAGLIKLFHKEKLRVHQQCWRIIVDQLAALCVSGLVLSVQGEYRLMVPYLVMCITDHPEACKMCGSYSSWKSSFPCRLCLCGQAQQHEFHKESDAPPWLAERRTMRGHAAFMDEVALLERLPQTKTAVQTICTASGYKSTGTAFLRAPIPSHYGIHGATPADLLHQIYLGLVLDCINCSFISLADLFGDDDVDGFNAACNELGVRLRHMPRFSDGKCRTRRFTSGLIGIDFKRLTGDDYLHLLGQLMFVFGEHGALFPNTPDGRRGGARILKAIQDVFTVSHVLVTKHTWGLADLDELETMLASMSDSMQAAFLAYSKSGMNKPKMHALCHIRFWICEFGAPIHYSASNFETHHLHAVKRPAVNTSTTSDVREQLLRANARMQKAASLKRNRMTTGQNDDDGASVSAVTPSTRSSVSSRASSSAESVLTDGGLLMQLSPVHGYKHTEILPHIPCDAVQFWRSLRFYVSEALDALPQRPVMSLARALRWEDQHCVAVDKSAATFFSSGRALDTDSREAVFNLVCSSHYRSRERYDHVYVTADGSPVPFVAKLLALLSYTHHLPGCVARHCACKDRFVLAFVRYYTRLPHASSPPGCPHTLPFDRLESDPGDRSTYQFIDVSSITSPAHVIPNFDTLLPPVPGRTGRFYGRYWLWKKHFPKIV